MSVSTKRRSEDPVGEIEDHFASLGATVRRARLRYRGSTVGLTAGARFSTRRARRGCRAAHACSTPVVAMGGSPRCSPVSSASAVTALDPVPDMLVATRQRSPGVSTVLARLGEPIPLPSATFDAVIAMRVLKWVPAWESAIEEIARVLAPGGRCVLEITNRRSIARFGYRGAPIALCSVGEVRDVARGHGVDLTDAYPGTHLPSSVLERGEVERDAPRVHGVATRVRLPSWEPPAPAASCSPGARLSASPEPRPARRIRSLLLLDIRQLFRHDQPSS